MEEYPVRCLTTLLYPRTHINTIIKMFVHVRPSREGVASGTVHHTQGLRLPLLPSGDTAGMRTRSVSEGVERG
jgi:hypothetical protein